MPRTKVFALVIVFSILFQYVIASKVKPKPAAANAKTKPAAANAKTRPTIIDLNPTHAPSPAKIPLDESAYITNVNHVGEQAYNGQAIVEPTGPTAPPSASIAQLKNVAKAATKLAKAAPKVAPKSVPKPKAKPSPGPVPPTPIPSQDPEDYPHAEEAEADEKAEGGSPVSVPPTVTSQITKTGKKDRFYG